jgi:hypothetical protein
MTRSILLLIAFPFLTFANELSVDFPKTAAKTLAEKEMNLPQDIGAEQKILVVSFSHDGFKKVGPCVDKHKADLVLGIIDGAPFFVKPIIRKKMRTSTPAEKHNQYLLIEENREALEAALAFDKNAKDDIYVAAIKDGKIISRSHQNHCQ